MRVALISMICFNFVYTSNALSVEERLLELERVVKLQGDILDKHQETIRDQNVIIKSFENENKELKLRVQTLENDRAKHEEGSKTDVATSYREVLGNMGNRWKAFNEEKAKDVNDISKRDNAAGNGYIQTSNRSHMVKRLRTQFHLPFTYDKDDLGRILGGESPNIAFHAYMTGQKCFHEQQLMVFNREVVDEGDGYSETDGIYVVPVTGTYVFTWTVFSQKYVWFRADIIIDGVSKGWILADSDNDQATGIVIARVNAGNHVFIRRDKGDGCNLHDDFARSTFSGWKLF
ncbi:uncharacterized protein LOC128558119 isoform X1 [Mercenaria mercenaria]|uniref:uncharacterized protein LOC128558119 isoform X1 n=1 Tax=Mercenaria mercenaria TaxID=6596 RepID=UPI00234E737E|nr:uncharacterized protein LOC128558119 isoform X1 [Mercenaria mercenaria]